jgi:hypothetical protein
VISVFVETKLETFGEAVETSELARENAEENGAKERTGTLIGTRSEASVGLVASFKELS